MPDLTIECAKAVIEESMKRHIVEPWPHEPSDEEVLSLASEIADKAAKGAKSRQEHGQEVSELQQAILFAAQVEPLATNGDGPGQPAVGEAAGTTPTVEQTDQLAALFASPAEPRPSPIDDVFPRYDTFKVKHIVDSVLASAASGDLQPEEWERIKAYEAAGEQRAPILTLQPEFKAPEPEPEPVQEAATPDAQTDAAAERRSIFASGAFGDQPAQPAAEEDSSDDYDTTAGMGAFYRGERQSRAVQERLPLPPDVDPGAVAVMPINITDVSDQELSKLATQYHSLFARTQWLVSQEEGRERAAEALEGEAHRAAYAHAISYHESAIPDDKRTGTALENARRQAAHDADGADPVKRWRNSKVRHGIDARELKALAVGFDKAVWRVNEELARRARLQTTRPS